MTIATPGATYATETDTYFVTLAGRIFIVGSEDEMPVPVEVDRLPAEAEHFAPAMVGEDVIDYVDRIEAEFGPEAVN